jgi:hypothetical protein
VISATKQAAHEIFIPGTRLGKKDWRTYRTLCKYDLISPLTLGLIQRGICLPEKLRTIVGILRVECQAD